MTINNKSLNKSWQDFLSTEKQKPYFKSIIDFINKEKSRGKNIFPPENEIFRAISFCEFKDIKVVIFGQDPYHGENQANGLAFSVNKGIKVPPSLRNIHKELESDLDIKLPEHGDLEGWASQGVLLLNTSLTVEESKPSSHSKIGWEVFTNRIIEELNDKHESLVFMLWGLHAQSKKCLINKKNHLILEASHPSPLSAYRGFLGCKHFSKANYYLCQNNISPIDWSSF